MNYGAGATKSLHAWNAKAFREYYTTNVLPALAQSTAVTYEATLNAFERTCKPQRLADVTTARITALSQHSERMGSGSHDWAAFAALKGGDEMGTFPRVANHTTQVHDAKAGEKTKLMRGRQSRERNSSGC